MRLLLIPLEVPSLTTFTLASELSKHLNHNHRPTGCVGDIPTANMRGNSTGYTGRERAGGYIAGPSANPTQLRVVTGDSAVRRLLRELIRLPTHILIPQHNMKAFPNSPKTLQLTRTQTHPLS